LLLSPTTWIIGARKYLAHRRDQLRAQLPSPDAIKRDRGND
jgi:hypothetical protein